MECVEVLGLKVNPIQEFEQAKEELKLAEQDFKYAAPEYIDAAIYRLNAAQAKLDNLRIQMEQRARKRVQFKWLNGGFKEEPNNIAYRA